MSRKNARRGQNISTKIALAAPSTQAAVVVPSPPTAPLLAASPVPTWITDHSAKVIEKLFFGGLYAILGVAVFQYNALRFNLGFVIASPYQYAIAGVIPAVLIALTIAACWVGKKIAVAGGNWFHATPKSNRFRSVLYRFVVLGISLTAWASLRAITNRPAGNAAFFYLAVFLTAFYGAGIAIAAPYFAPESSYKKPPSPRWLRVERTIGNATVGFCPVLFLFLWIFAYGSGFYPELPQEWGGMKPRAAYLDVTRAQLSPEIRKALLPVAARQATVRDIRSDPTPVVQTVLIDVAFDAGDYLLVRPHGAPATPTYRLKREVVQNIAWYGYRQPRKQ